MLWTDTETSKVYMEEWKCCKWIAKKDVMKGKVDNRKIYGYKNDSCMKRKNFLNNRKDLRRTLKQQVVSVSSETAFETSKC